MKRIIFFCLLTTTLFACRHHHNHNLDISVKDKESYYQFYASFNENRTDDVQYYINKYVSPSKLFESTEDYFDANTELDDGTKLYVKSHPGYLKIKLNKRDNSEESYAKVKNICNGIKVVLTRNY